MDHGNKGILHLYVRKGSNSLEEYIYIYIYYLKCQGGPRNLTS